MPTIYGIPNCDTMKKARAWLAENGVDYRFHDYRKVGIDLARLQVWDSAVGWETLLNRRGTTWRKLDEDVRADVDRDSALQLMIDNPSIIKRPVLELDDGRYLVGFKADDYQQAFGN
ncbi:MAG: ArsC family reductase [Gammaproteobacteria bacterium]|nr:ArsC family reductase [Gammaproteobacteria bacterium]